MFRSGRTVYAVLSNENYAELGPQIGVPTCVIERRPTFDVKLKNMLTRELLPELVLITNKCDVESQAPNPESQHSQIPNPSAMPNPNSQITGGFRALRGTR